MTFKETVVGALAKLRATTESPTARRNMKRGAVVAGTVLAAGEILAGCGLKAADSNPGASATPTPIDAKPSAGPVANPDLPKYVTDSSYADYLWLNQKTLTNQADKTAFAAMTANDPIVSSDFNYFTYYNSHKDIGDPFTTFPKQAFDVAVDKDTGVVHLGFWVNGQPKLIKVDQAHLGRFVEASFWSHQSGLPTDANTPADTLKFFEDNVGKEVIIGPSSPTDPSLDNTKHYGNLFPDTRAFEKYLEGKGPKPASVLNAGASQDQIKNAATADVEILYYSSAF